MPNSDSEPVSVFLDYVENGRCRLLVHWNIVSRSIVDVAMRQRNTWDYSERVIWWVLPKKCNDVDEVLRYLKTIETEIVDYAVATETSLKPEHL
jgi:hypothetical protein